MFRIKTDQLLSSLWLKLSAKAVRYGLLTSTYFNKPWIKYYYAVTCLYEHLVPDLSGLKMLGHLEFARKEATLHVGDIRIRLRGSV
jgi:hypothetical protein